MSVQIKWVQNNSYEKVEHRKTLDSCCIISKQTLDGALVALLNHVDKKTSG